MKCHEQIDKRCPSGLIPLCDGMIISFVNYELKVKFEERTQHEINALKTKADDYFKNRKIGNLGYDGETFVPNKKQKQTAYNPMTKTGGGMAKTPT